MPHNRHCDVHVNGERNSFGQVVATTKTGGMRQIKKPKNEIRRTNFSVFKMLLYIKTRPFVKSLLVSSHVMSIVCHTS